MTYWHEETSNPSSTTLVATSTLILPSRNDSEIVHLDDILMLKAEGSYTQFILENDKSILTSRSIGKYEELLEENGFVRIHQSTIVNLKHILKYKKGDGGEVILKGGIILKVSRQKKKDFLEKIQKKNSWIGCLWIQSWCLSTK